MTKANLIERLQHMSDYWYELRKEAMKTRGLSKNEDTIRLFATKAIAYTKCSNELRQLIEKSKKGKV